MYAHTGDRNGDIHAPKPEDISNSLQSVATASATASATATVRASHSGCSKSGWSHWSHSANATTPSPTLTPAPVSRCGSVSGSLHVPPPLPVELKQHRVARTLERELAMGMGTASTSASKVVCIQAATPA